MTDKPGTIAHLSFAQCHAILEDATPCGEPAFFIDPTIPCSLCAAHVDFAIGVQLPLTPAKRVRKVAPAKPPAGDLVVAVVSQGE